MHRNFRRTVPVVAAVVGGLLSFSAWTHVTPPDRLPDRLADSTFWRIVSTFSEPSGYFSSENFVSNETEWQYVIPGALQRLTPGAYIGVGPEQNFTYIAAFRPRIAFICDIRRQNLIQHLMYKALIELSADRTEFLSRLWSRRRPELIDSASAPAEIVAALRSEKPDSLFFSLNIGAIFDRLVNVHKFALSSEDSTTLRTVFSVFFAHGPDISYSSSSNAVRSGMPNAFGGVVTANGRLIWNWNATTSVIVNGVAGVTRYNIRTDSAGRVTVMRDSAGTYVRDTTLQPNALAPSTMPMSFAGVLGGYATFASLMTEDDGTGANRGWLGTEAAFQTVRDYQLRNMIVPVVGNFGGPTALRAVGDYLRAHDARVSAFYTSNVEQYLFQNRIAGNFYDNVATLPTDTSSVFIRSFPQTFGVSVAPRRPGSRLAQSTSSIDTVLRAHRAGTLASYQDLARVQDR